MASLTSSRVVLIFGAGANVGASLVKGFLGAGYRVATVSRSNKPSSPSSSSSAPSSDSTPLLRIQADLSDTSAVLSVFTQLSAADWPVPSVVIWNAANVTQPAASDPGNPLEVPLEEFDRDLGLMVRSPYIAAREAVRMWKKKMEAEREREAGIGRNGTFILTGNLLPRKILPVPSLVDLGVGKSAANYWVGLSDATFRKDGIRFFFADERAADGSAVGSKIDGAGHSEMYLRLTEDDEVPYYVTFVDGKYKEIL
ncbi:hypothetical protein N0V82_007321 [Gnomoniopsis sp. IMI 355080]|nr:hypothetical protein N0V82_007321 [Gnomoniopsis sp. IMI 355080]